MVNIPDLDYVKYTFLNNIGDKKHQRYEIFLDVYITNCIPCVFMLF